MFTAERRIIGAGVPTSINYSEQLISSTWEHSLGNADPNDTDDLDLEDVFDFPESDTGDFDDIIEEELGKLALRASHLV